MSIVERYAKLGDDDNFDIDFWQKQGPVAIFEAAFSMVKDYLLLKENYADEPRLQRTIETFQSTQR